MPETSARIIVLGAGPIGLETALYARYLGFSVEILDRAGSVAANVIEWGHVQLFTPFSMNATPLGVAAIQAHDANWDMPVSEELLTGEAYVRRYLQPLSKTDLLAGTLKFGTQVLSIGRQRWLKHEGVEDPRRGESPFHLLCLNADGDEQVFEADVVIDCTGTYGNHKWLGQGGTPALGERSAAGHIEYGIPDVLGSERDAYEGRHTLIVGAGYSAATVATQLSRLSGESSTQVTWVTRQPGDRAPIGRIEGDRLSSRDQLAKAANTLAEEKSGSVTHFAETSVTAVRYREASDDFEVEFEGQHTGTYTFDRVVANVGYRPDNQIYEELQVHECYASGGPMKLAAQLLAQKTPNATADCLDQTPCGPESLLNPEPNFYILGSKSYGRGSQFLLSIGFQQIRDLFTIVGEREDLDLYATMPKVEA